MAASRPLRHHTQACLERQGRRSRQGLLRMVLGILPDFQIIAMLLQFYTVYVAWEGSARLLQVSDANRLRFTLTASVLLIVCPMLIEWIFNRLTIMLN